MTQRPVHLTSEQLRRIVRETIKSEMAPKTRRTRDTRAMQAMAQLGKIGIADGNIADDTVGLFDIAKGPPGGETQAVPSASLAATNITGGQINSGAKLLLLPVALNEYGPRWYAVQQTSSPGMVTEYSRLVRFTLTADWSAPGMTATLEESWGESSIGPAVGETITVVDQALLYPAALTGASGMAIAHESTPTIWNVLACDQMAIFAEGIVAGSGYVSGTTISVNSVTAESEAPFSQAPPTSVTAENPNDVCLFAGTSVMLRRQLTGTWVIVNTNHAIASLITDVRVDAATMKIEVKRRDVTILPCEDNSAWEDIHTGMLCPDP